MPVLSLQLSFGGFGDIVTLIDLILKTKDCLIDGAHVREEVQEFVQFLDRYVETLHCIRSVLSSASSKGLPNSLTNAISHALAESKKLVQEFLGRLNSFKPLQWWGSTLVQAFRWALCSKKALQELQEKLVSQGNSITLLLSLSGLHITLDLASSATYKILPAQPPPCTIGLVDFLDQRAEIPLEFCLDKAASRPLSDELYISLIITNRLFQTFNKFLLFYFHNRAGLSFIKRGDYEVRRSSRKATSKQWDIEPGESLNMSAILHSREDDDRCCPRCKKLNNTNVPEYDGEIKCFYCQTFFRIAKSRIEELDVDTGDSTTDDIEPTNETQKASQKDEIDELQYIRRILVHSRETSPLGFVPAQIIQPGSVTYTTSMAPDGITKYHSFKAVPASYQTPNGIVSGIQWIPTDTVDFVPDGLTPELVRDPFTFQPRIPLFQPQKNSGLEPLHDDDFTLLRQPPKPAVPNDQYDRNVTERHQIIFPQ
ncbi:hypothetical protein QCA50_015514 [Cerrena zonata]|uniref:Fungal N-terminal domain-containing protein n=1 Tax=Cerrena zonata TaxID=2478898 RepID=A0AAW0FQ74_9APHY